MPVPGGGEESGSGTDGGDGGAGGAGVPAPLGPEAAPVPLELPDPDGIVGGGRIAREIAPRIECKGLFGSLIVWQPYVKPGGGGYPNFTMYCGRPEHEDTCKKTKGMTERNTSRLGRIEPLCFLHAWHGCDDPKGHKPHNLVEPSKELVQRMFEQHEDEIRAIMDSLGIPRT